MEIKFFKKQKKFKKGGLSTNLDIYWKYIFYITLVLIVISSAFGLYLFLKINNKSIVSIANTDIENTIKKERVEKVLEYFSEREKKAIEILNSPSPIIDPSL